ncbi:hypothetical protein HDU77_007654 [Chytriomyces hyalinus]|nr:hypothetical protein HDU77_007654 [Chytriomyces hyalinus]
MSWSNKRPSPPLSMQSSDQLYSSAFDSGVNAANADLDLDIEFFNQLTDETANAPPPLRSFDANLLSSNLSSILSSPNITNSNNNNNNNNRGPLAVSTSFPQATTSFHPHSPFPASPLHANNSIEFEQFRSASRHAIQVILAASSPRPPATPQIRNSFDKPIEFAPFATSQFTPSTPVAPVSSAAAVAALSEAAAASSVFGTPNFNHQQQQQQQSYRMIASPMISNVQHFQHASVPLSPMIPTLHPMTTSVESLEAMTAHRLSDLSQGYLFDANQQQHGNDQDFQYGHYSIIEGGSKQECTTQDDHHTHIINHNTNNINNNNNATTNNTNNKMNNNTSSSPLIDSSKSVHNIPITAIRTDNGKSLFICPWEGCQRQFTRPYNLRSHYRQHTGERPFACTQCSLSFSRHHDLKRHTLIHAGGKQHACPACNRSFLRSDALKRHLKPNGDDSKLSKCLYIIHDRQLPLLSLDPSFLQSSLGRLQAGRKVVGGGGGGVSDQEEEEEEDEE